MSFRNEPGLIEAVQSLLDQQPQPDELVVVNTGGGGAAKKLAEAGLGYIPVIDEEEPGFAGRARNLGIKATRSRYVAFLAADCLAEPGWVAGRLARHWQGSACVGTPVTNAFPDSSVAEAAQLFTYWTRLPLTPVKWRAPYGASYDRGLFKRYGLFREDLRAGEDSDLNNRLFEAYAFAWAPEVRTAHRHVRTLPGLVHDQFVRGRRGVLASDAMLGTDPRISQARTALRCAKNSCKFIDRSSESGKAKRGLTRALIYQAAAARALGVLVTRPPVARSNAAVRASRRRLIALVQFRNEMRFLPGLFCNLLPHVDGIVALDDGSTDGSLQFVRRQDKVLDIIETERRFGGEWDEPENHRLLVTTALPFGPDWLFAIDADERVERDFRTRAEAEFDRADRENHGAYAVQIRETWDREDQIRVDGWFGKKNKATLFRARPDHLFDEKRVHCQWAPLNDYPAANYPQADLYVYHQRMLHRSDRELRKQRYEELDPNREYQSIGYDYLTDETGLELAPLPEGRGYLPLERHSELLL
jgi:glycosyltransferase involved in cell wall biosynthesis